ncbi:carbohydrate-binding family 9-like protein [Mucilaginibacter sp. X5P1]|uniref:carbohydrate-binding family 9-like protein n=1 Tax=Mucilaginibacter sp. X5P1 TaxID=2723088 RepID=UPI0016221B75|nr:carbohydrate-binding family 9-like protein [Mucilaginibacter sp. X5P1]MBB6141673.1 hypothetical protein [Mucilaginibacter sp. X5P1]
MKELQVLEIENDVEVVDINKISVLLENYKKYQPIQQICWQDFPDKPSVAFSMNYNLRNIFLKYFIWDESVRVVNFNINDRVYEDSCVGFFVSFDDGNSYYNLEFNCLGICRAGYGKNKEDRVLLSTETITQIICKPHFMSSRITGKTNFYWELTLSIPISIFKSEPDLKLKGRSVKANFYKSGDFSPKPNFLSWTRIESEQPDFHLPQFFGTCKFL